MNNFQTGSKVYLDANFLIAYSLPRSIAGPYARSAKRLIAEAMAKNCDICVSTLGFDELWWVVKKEMGANKPVSRFLMWVNKRSQRFFRLNLRGSSLIEVLPILKPATTALLNNIQLNFLGFSNSHAGVRQALDLIELKIISMPRDSFHLALAIDNGVTHFVSRDKKLLSGVAKVGITPVNFS